MRRGVADNAGGATLSNLSLSLACRGRAAFIGYTATANDLAYHQWLPIQQKKLLTAIAADG